MTSHATKKASSWCPGCPRGFGVRVTQVRILAPPPWWVTCAKDLQAAPVSSSGNETHLNDFTRHTQTINTWCFLLQPTSKIGGRGLGAFIGPEEWPPHPASKPQGQSFLLPPSALQPLVKKTVRDFPGGAVVENLPADAGDTGSSPGLGRSHMPRSN